MYWVPNGRWRSVPPGNLAVDVNPLLSLTPNVWEDGFTVFFQTPQPNLTTRLIFTKPTGMWLKIPATDFYYGSDGLPGGRWAAYTFGHYELSEGGTWQVNLESGGQSGYFKVHGSGWEVGILPSDVLTGAGEPITDSVGRFMTR